MKNYMKKSRVISSLICMITFFSYIYASCILGADKMGKEKEHIVTINGIEMYNSVATDLLNNVIDKKEMVNIVDNNTGKNLNVGTEILKPGMDILINNSKSMQIVLNLFEIAKLQAKNSKPETSSYVVYETEAVLLMKASSGGFSISSNYKAGDKNFLLCINDEFQITKIISIPIVINSQSETDFAIPIHE